MKIVKLGGFGYCKSARKITYLNPPKLVVLDFELQRRFAANYLFRQCIPGNDYTLTL